jgi:hypothetical protein
VEAWKLALIAVGNSAISSQESVKSSRQIQYRASRDVVAGWVYAYHLAV